MFTDTIQQPIFKSLIQPLAPQQLTPLAQTTLKPFPSAQFTSVANPDTSFVMYSRYRELALHLINTENPEVFYRTYYNEKDSYNGEGVHEKFVYRGQAILDLSVGLLDFPWFAADGNPLNEITQVQLQNLANTEFSPQIALRLRQISNFAATLPPYTRYYHYTGLDGTRALTVCDEFNGIKLNCILTHTEESIF